MELKDEIREIIVSKVADIKRIDKASLSDSTNLKTEVAIKSVEMVGVISALEDEFEVYLDIIKLRKCETIGAMCDFVASLIEG